MKILCVCLSATIQRTAVFSEVKLCSVNRAKHYRMDASGKAVNAARVLCQLEAGCAKVLCPLGEDNALSFISLAKRDDLETVYVKTPGRTRECWTLLDSAHGTTTEIVADENGALGMVRYTPPVAEHSPTKEFCKAEEELLRLLEAEIAVCDAVLLAGSCPRVWSEGLMAQIALLARNAGKFFMADYHGKDLKATLKVCTPSVIKINKEEFCETFDMDTSMTDDELSVATAQKSRALSCIVVVTQGALPTVAANGGNAILMPVEKVKAVNTTACGDSFAAGFLHEYLKARDFEGALKKGTWCAARNAEREAPGDVAGK